MEIEQSVCLNARMESVCDVCTCMSIDISIASHTAQNTFHPKSSITRR